MQRLPRALFVACVALVAMAPSSAMPQSSAATGTPQLTNPRRDGAHDFDFEVGTWKTHLRRLVHPLSGSSTWVEYEGTTVVRRCGAGAPTSWSSSPMAPRATLKR
jgi:hypothetical protein